jgi:hypothetical protein
MTVATMLLLIVQTLQCGYFLVGYFTKRSLAKVADFPSSSFELKRSRGGWKDKN